MSEWSRQSLQAAGQLEGLGLPARVAAPAVGVHETTLRRWRRRAAQGEALVRPRGPRPQPLDPHARERAAELVRALAGQVGAESLRRSVPGLSRRGAAEVKREVTRALERERRRRVERITVTTPGVLRGFDAMHISRRLSLLVAGDGSVPYRTRWAKVECYDGSAVAALLERDIALHGAPLVLRMDRARQHSSPDVQRLLAQHQILLLQGPPYRPQYYGQLERQNREHRGWLEATAHGFNAAADIPIDAMMDALNGLWRRRTLGWRTARDVWQDRKPVQVDRAELRREVEREVESLRLKPALQGKPEHMLQRLAIEHALQRRGLLTRERSGWC